MRNKIEALLAATIPSPLVKALLDAHLEIKDNFYQGRFRASELEGGRFAEAAIRIVEELTTGKHTALGRALPAFDEDYLKRVSSVAKTGSHDSLRVHIPRALFSVYGIRNRRDVGHIGGDVNPNHADATLIVSVCDWVLVEFIRLTYNCSLSEAQSMVDDLVERKMPIIQDFSGFPKILKAGLSIPDRILVLAYWAGAKGVDIKDLQKWMKPTTATALSTALLRLERNKLFIHRDGSRCMITTSGNQYVEAEIGFVFMN